MTHHQVSPLMLCTATFEYVITCSGSLPTNLTTVPNRSVVDMVQLFSQFRQLVFQRSGYAPIVSTFFAFSMSTSLINSVVENHVY